MARKKIYINKAIGYYSVAISENGKLIEYTRQKPDNAPKVGNVYKGVVTNVLEGMQAAFINCGLERNCYISADDLLPNAQKVGSDNLPTKLNLKVGDEIMVQIIKLPINKKGAKVTTHISIIGKNIIYLPNTDFKGVSRKIADDELRENLTFTVGRIVPKGQGIIVRTSAPYVNLSQTKDELYRLMKIYDGIKLRFESAKVGDLIYTDSDFISRILRDNALTEIDCIYTADKQIYDMISEQLLLFPSAKQVKAELIDTKRDLFEYVGMLADIESMFSPKVELENGAYLVIEPTEALTVIDVNTGRFIGEDCLEDTVYYTNQLAAREIARQVRLRNISGIVVVDFIDMTCEEHREGIVRQLERELYKDKSKCSVDPMSRLGLVEFTRKRMGSATTTSLIEPCKHCQGSGMVIRTESIQLLIRAQLLKLLEGDETATVSIDLNYNIAQNLMENKELIDDVFRAYPFARVYVVSHRTFPERKFHLRKHKSGTLSLPEGSILLY